MSVTLMDRLLTSCRPVTLGTLTSLERPSPQPPLRLCSPATVPPLQVFFFFYDRPAGREPLAEEGIEAEVGEEG